MRKTLFVLVSLFIILHSVLMVGLPVDALADGSVTQVVALRNSVPKGATEEVAGEAPRIFERNVLPMIRGNNLFLESTYTDEEFKQVTFSQPIPVFCTPIRYQKNEQFKSRLPLYAWMFVGYIDDAPITLFFIDNNNYSKEYKYNDLMGQGVAQSCVAAMQQLGTKDVVCIPVNGFYFIADDSDNVALIKSPNDTTSYPIVSFEQLNAAVNRSINASADEEYPAAGGGVFLENLYSDNNLDVDNQSLDQLKVITTVASLVVLLVFGAFIVAKNAQRITESQHTT